MALLSRRTDTAGTSLSRWPTLRDWSGTSGIAN